MIFHLAVNPHAGCSRVLKSKVKGMRRSRWIFGVILLALEAALVPGICAESDSKEPAPLSLEQVVRSLDARSRARAQALRQFDGIRTYRVQYHGFPSGHAEMVVAVHYRAPATKDFRIVSQSGSKLIIDHVFKPLLESEHQGAADPARVEVTSRNYEFALTGFEPGPEGGLYVLTAKPRFADRFLFRGRVWVDARDFAVVRIEGQPSESLSFWIRRTEIHHTYRKVESFWLPAEDLSTTYLRLGGHADLSIQYDRYDIRQADPVPSTDVEAGVSPLAITTVN